MNFVELVRRVRRESGRSGSGPASLAFASTEDLRIADWVNDAWLAIQGEPYNWRWMRRSATSALPAATSHPTSSLGIPRFGRFIPEDDEYRVSAFVTADSASEWTLRWVNPDRFRRMFMSGNVPAAAKPTYWSVDYDGSLLLGPQPDVPCTVRFDYRPSDQSLTADADVPELPSEHHLAVVWMALMICATNDAAPEVFTRAANSYSDAENRLIADQGEKISITSRPLA